MSEHPALIGIVEKFVGSSVRLMQDMALLKPPLVGRETLRRVVGIYGGLTLLVALALLVVYQYFS